MILLSASAVPPDGLETEIAGCVAKGTPVQRLIDSVKRAADGLPLAVEPARQDD